MPKSSFIQSMKPFVRYCMIITPVILIITAFTSGIFTTQTPTVGADVGALNNKKDTEMGVALLPSTKYAAVDVKGLHRNNDVKVVAAEKFSDLIVAAKNHPRKRKMNDLTKNAESNSMQTLINTWTDGSYSPVHKHVDYSEAFVVLQGALAFFTFNENGSTIQCHVIHNLSPEADRLIIVEKNQYHAMTAAPVSMGWPGFAVVFESSGHTFDVSKQTKILASFAPIIDDGMDGDPVYFEHTLLKLCSTFSAN